MEMPLEIRIRNVAALICALPDANRTILKRLLLFLQEVARHSDKNLMTVCTSRLDMHQY
jgi:hypothetical protein